jgi:hypothetical protein
MSGSETKEVYRGWTIVVTVGAWPHGKGSQERFVPSVAIVPPEKLQQRFLDVGGGAAFLHRVDAERHGLVVAKDFIDAQERGTDAARSGAPVK